MAGKGLTDKQKRFCEEYVKDSNGAQAAIRAGYSKKTAKEQAARLLTKVNITDYLVSLQCKISERNEITVDWYIEELKHNSALARMHKQVSASNGALKQIAEVVNLISDEDKEGKQAIINIYPASAK